MNRKPSLRRAWLAGAGFLLVLSLAGAAPAIPYQVQILYYAARHHHKQKQYDRAMGLYQRVIEIMPELGDAYLHLAYAYEDAGRFEEAIARWEALLKLKKDRFFFLSPAGSQVDFASEIERLKELLKPKEGKKSPTEEKKEPETEAKRYEKLSYRQVKAKFLSADRLQLYVGRSEGAVQGAPVTVRVPEVLVYVVAPGEGEEASVEARSEFGRRSPRFLRGAVEKAGFSFCVVALHKPAEGAPLEKLVRLDVSFDTL